MKRACIAVSGIFLSLVLFVYSGWAAQAPPRDRAWLYKDSGCDTGQYMDLGVGSYSDLRAYKIVGTGGVTWNDQISCITIGSGITKVIVYEHINYEGRSKEFSQAWGNRRGKWGLGDDWWNDRISSVKVVGPGYSEPSGESIPPNKALFYQDGGCDSGNYATLGVGEYSDLRAYKIVGSGGVTWNDQISCITIGSGITKVIVYEDINFGGRSKEFSQAWGNRRGKWSLGDDWWNDRISSVKIR